MNTIIKILAIDDNLDNLISLKALINESFHEASLFTTTSGTIGIELAKVEDPDMILLDIVMPGMDGFEVCRKLKANPILRDIPVVFLTALKGDKESRIRALECGGEAFLAKPIDETELTAQIRAMMKIKQANLEKRNEKERLAALVQERTHQLQQELEERKLAEKALRESEERFQLLFNEAPLGYQSLDIEGYFIEVNQQWLNTLGYAREEVIGKWFGNFLSPEYKDGFRQRFPIFKAQGYIHSEFEMIHKNGSKLFIAFEGRIGYDLKGNFKQTHCILQDITQNKKAIDALKESEERFKRVFESANVGKSMTLPTGEINVNQAFCNMIGYTKDELKNKKWQDITPQDEVPFIEAQILPIILGEKDETRLLKRYIHKNGSTIWCDTSVAAIRDLQGKLVHFITTVIDINEQIKAEKALRESEEVTRALLNGIPESAFLIEINGTVISANNTVAQRLGKIVEELIGKNIYQMVSPEVAGLRRKFANQVIESKKPVQFEDERFGKTIDNRIHPVFDIDGNINRLAIVGIDITERKMAEMRIRESEMRSRSIFDQSPVGSVIVGLDKRFIKCNAAFCRFLGYTENELIGKTIADVTFPEDRELGMSDLKLMVEGKLEISNLQKRYLRKDGTIVWGEISISIVRDTDNNPIYFLPVIQDISERIKVENELKKSETLYRKMNENSPLGMHFYKLNNDNQLIFTGANPSANLLLGIDHDQFIGKNIEEAFPSLAKTEVPERYRNAAEKGYSWETEQFIYDDGKISGAFEVRAFQTSPGNMVAVFSDITNRKKSEEALRKSELKYRSLIENTSDVVFCVNEKGEYQFTNHVFASTFGKTPDYFIGKTFWDIYPKEEADFRFAATKRVFETGLTQSVEVSVPLPDKTLYFIAKANPIKDETGKVILNLTSAIDITERKEAEERIKEQEVQYRNLADSGQALIWTSGTNKLCNYFNEPWLRFTGRTLEQEFGNGWTEGVHPDDFDRCLQTYSWAFDHRESFEMEYRLYHASGEYRWLHDMGTPNYDSRGEFIGYIGHCFDITERKQIEKELVRAKEKAETSEQFLKIKNEELLSRNTFIQTILENLPIGIALNEINSGQATYMNKKFQEIYGWSSKEITSIPSFFEKVYPNEKYRNELINRIMIDINSGDPKKMHWENIEATHKDGNKRVINAVNIPLLEQNTMVSTVIDITDLHNIQKDLIAAKEKAEESDRLKSAFLANMSHEIRTPMNSIMGFASLLPDEESKELLTNYARIIVQSSEQLVHIIDDIVLYSRLQTKLLSYFPRKFNTYDLLCDVKQSYNLPDLQRNVKLLIDCDLDKSVEIYSDYEKLRQIVTNLISNSFKYTSEGSIVLGLSKDISSVAFYITDTGIGIPHNEQEKIFDRFFRASNINKGVIGGTGLGLSIVKELIELLGGKIWVESEINKGTTFHFSIPFKKN